MTVLRKYLPQFLILLFAAGLYLSGNLAWMERWLLDLRFSLIDRSADGDVIVVEIDGASLQVLDSWPWPRRYHADVLDRLVDAGARAIAFDVDFSSHSNALDDTVFAEALARASGRAVLPVFRQRAGAGRSDKDTLATLPISLFARSARLASANVYPDADGRVRRLPVGQRIAGKTYVNLPVLLTGAASGLPMEIAIDFSIRPDSIPRLSFKDVREGRFDPAQVRGKAVIVGATAPELGNQLPTSVHTVLSGPVLHALAYETIVQDRVLLRLHEPVIVLGIAIIALLLGPPLLNLGWRRGGLVTACCVIGLFALTVAVQAIFPLAIEISPWLLVIIASYLFGLCLVIERQSVDLIRRRMEVRQNRAIVDAALHTFNEGIVICDWDGNIRVVNEAAAALFGEQRETLIGRPVETLIDRLACPEIPVFYRKLSQALMQLSDFGRPLRATLRRPDDGRRTIEMEVSRAVVRKDEEEIERRTVDRVYFTISLRDLTDRSAEAPALGRTSIDTDDEVLVLRPDRLN